MVVTPSLPLMRRCRCYRRCQSRFASLPLLPSLPSLPSFAVVAVVAVEFDVVVVVTVIAVDLPNPLPSLPC
jgi:hypothetical protein